VGRQMSEVPNLNFSIANLRTKMGKLLMWLLKELLQDSEFIHQFQS